MVNQILEVSWNRGTPMQSSSILMRFFEFPLETNHFGDPPFIENPHIDGDGLTMIDRSHDFHGCGLCFGASIQLQLHIGTWNRPLGRPLGVMPPAPSPRKIIIFKGGINLPFPVMGGLWLCFNHMIYNTDALYHVDTPVDTYIHIDPHSIYWGVWTGEQPTANS